MEVCSGEKRFESQLLLRVDVLKYLGSNIQSNRKCTREVKKSLQGGWSGWFIDVLKEDM